MNIRRFDVFAEWNRLLGRKKAMDEEDAAAYGVAVAKIVAARRFTGYEPGQVKEWKERAGHGDTERRNGSAAEAPWRERLGSAEEFERKVVARMGERFYETVFAPAVRAAWERGEKYEDIRDRLREDWNAARKKPAAA